MRWRQRLPLLALLVVVLLAAGVRLHDSHKGFWLDELITGWVVVDGFGSIPARSWICNLSPLYFWIAGASSFLFGWSELALRLPSIAAGLAFVGLLFALLRKIEVPVGPALAATLAAAVDPHCVGLSLSARPYALLLVLVLVHTLVFYRLVWGPAPARSTWLAYAVVHVVCFYLHYTAILALVGQAAFFFFRAGPDAGSRPRRGYALACALIGAACLPALPHLRYVASKSQLLGPLLPGELTDVLSRYNLDKYVLFPLLACFVLAVVLRARLREQVDSDWLRASSGKLACALFLYMGPMLSLWVLGKAKLIEIWGYTHFCLPLVLVLFAGALASLRPRARAACGVAALLFVHTNWTSPLRSYLAEGDFGGARQGWRESVAEIRDRAARGDVVLVDAGLAENAWVGTRDSELLRGYLLCPVNGIYPLDPRVTLALPIREQAVPLTPAELASVRGAGRVFVLAPVGHSGVTGAVQRTLAERGVRLQPVERRLFAGVTVSVLAPVE